MRFKEGYETVIFRINKKSKEQIRELVEAGEYKYNMDFVNEAIDKHLKFKLAEFEIKQARKIAEEEYNDSFVKK